MPKTKLFSLIKDPNIGGRILMVLVILVVLIIAVLLSGPKPVEYSDLPSGEPVPPAQTNVETLDTFGSRDDGSNTEYPITGGVIVGAVAILLIIEIGTMVELKRNHEK